MLSYHSKLDSAYCLVSIYSLKTELRHHYFEQSLTLGVESKGLFEHKQHHNPCPHCQAVIVVFYQ